MSETRGRVTRLWHRLFDEQSGDALPRELIAVALAAATLAAWAGWYIDGWTFRGYDVTVNILASLVVLGPGLYLSNILVKRWRERRERQERQEVHRQDRRMFRNLLD